MTITLPPELAERIRRRLADGRYENELEVVEHALSALDAEDEMSADVRAQIDEGVKQADEGRLIRLDLEDFLRRANARHEPVSVHAE